MNSPVFDSRSRQDLLAAAEQLARAYTPEWRYEDARDDPGAALIQLFCDMFYQTVDRMNSVPEKLFTEFLTLVGFRMPGPAPAEGLLQFFSHNTVTEPVPVPQGTQVFTRDQEGETVVYETERRLEATSAQLTDVFYVDGVQGVIQTLNFATPQPFFSPCQGENLQRHCFSLSQNEVLAVSEPCTIEVELRQSVRFLEGDTAKRLSQAEKVRWSFYNGGAQIPFDNVTARGGVLVLEKRSALPLEADEAGRLAVTCTGLSGTDELVLDGVLLRSTPSEACEADSLAFGDVPILSGEGGYCFGRRPAAYGFFYIRSDCTFQKRGAQAHLTLDLSPIVTDLADQSPAYLFNQRIIDKRDAVAVRPDEVFISHVVWEYFNGQGWRPLETQGDKNPFSCKREGRLELTFWIPADISATEVNAETGYYVRARVVEVENVFSMTPKWIVPFLRSVECSWSYGEGRPIDCCWAENNGHRVELSDVGRMSQLGLEAFVPMEETPRSMYFRFDRSPHGMPLSLLFEVIGRAEVEDKLLFEAWTGKRFVPVRFVDLTGNLQHTGPMYLYLSSPVPETVFFGRTGCWLRLSRSSYREAPVPRVAAVKTNVVSAIQRQRAEDQYFDTGIYEAGKTVRLLFAPVLDCEVWVDEGGTMAVNNALALQADMPDRVRLERDGVVVLRCWVRWERVEDLALMGPEAYAFELEPYNGTISFGDGIHGRVPPHGDHNIRVRYHWGGGAWGNVPAGAITELVGSVPRIGGVVNITAMSGGTDRFPQEKVEALGNCRLRHRGRAVGRRDFEEMVSEAFPRVMHVKCFSGLDDRGEPAFGHVTLVVAGQDLDGDRVTTDLCQRIYEYLISRCSCNLTAEGRLHVCPALVLTVSTQVMVELEQLDEAAATQQEIAQRLEHLMNVRWQSREIGSQVRIDEVWQTVREIPNVRLIRKILVEGAYHQDAQPMIAALESDTGFPYATVRSGIHLVQVY